MLRLRRTGWPAEVTEAVRSSARAAGLGREEVLAAIRTESGDWAAGSRSALYLPHGDGLRRIGWEQVEHAEWNADESVLHVWETTAFGTPLRRTDLAIDDPGRFGQLLRERISASVLVDRHVPLEGRKGVRIVGRRNPAAADAEITWNFVLDKGLDPGLPGLLDRAEHALADVRDELGL